MSLLDRILGRTPVENRPTIVEIQKPHNFCAYCGEPMVNGWMSTGRGFDRETGSPVLHVRRTRLCLSLHKQDYPWGDEDTQRAQGAHDGFPVTFWGGFHGESDVVPDCEPRKEAAA